MYVNTRKMELNTAQNQALKHVLSGHNLLLLGAAGTGKTFILKRIVQALQNEGKRVALTATTGIACCLYDNASTVHRWSGIGDGRHDVSEIRNVVENNVQFTEVKNRVTQTDVLVIDECSMLSKKMFESLNEVCKLKDPQLFFGGIQLILSGDFTQLPPVPNQMYGEEGDFCFTNELFENILPHRVKLTEVIRQTEKELIKAIQEIANGIVSIETEVFMKGLTRPLPCDTDSIKLFARNEQVDVYNRNRIIDFPGQLYEFRSADEGHQKHLNKILAPKTLWLKIGAPVILLRNLSNKLVNGLRGNIYDISETGPVVEFPSLNVKVPLERFRFSVFSPSRNTDVAVRIQFPIKLSFAMSIHKSQGLTLDSLEIDCRQIFKPGQLGVALGRARETKGLRVINFNVKKSVISQPACVMNFMQKVSADFQEDRSCCNNKQQRLEEPIGIGEGNLTVDDMIMIDELTELDEQESSEEFDSEFDEVIKMICETQSESVNLPTDLDLDGILTGIKCTIVKTPMQYNTNKILTEIDHAKYIQFCKNEYAKLSFFVEELDVDPSKSVPSKLQTEFYTKVHAYQVSAEFRMNCLTFFESMQCTEDHLHICFNISNQIRTYLLKKKAELFPVGKRKISDRIITNASEARVRYVGGYCIAKVRNKYMQKKKSYMYKVDETGQAVYNESLQAVDILDSIKVEEYYLLATTTKPESLLDVYRKQGLNRSLTNIPDDLFQFFQILTEKCLQLLVDENMNKYGSNLFEEIKNKILESSELYNEFFSVVDKCRAINQDLGENYVQHSDNNVVKIIYKKIIKIYLMVMVNQFRKDVLDAFSIEKKMAHRKQVQVSEKSKVKSKAQKESQNDDERPSTSNDSSIPIIEPTCSSSRPKRRRKIKKSSEISSSDDEHINIEIPLEKPKDQADNFEMSENSDEETSCQVCNLNQNTAPSQTQWINCDGCNGWLHRKCAGLQHHLRWKKFNKKDEHFYCQQCE